MKKSIYVEKTYDHMRIDRFIRSHLGKIPQGLIAKRKEIINLTKVI